MKIVFFGTPEYVLPILKLVHKTYVTGPGKSPIVAVVTQSPKPMGRKQILSYSAIDKWAHDHKIDTYYEAKEMLEDNIDADLGILAAHGEIITKEVIAMFPQGILVVHPSLLPKFRGASPIQASIATGVTTTGVSIIRMDDKVDHGPIIAQFKEDIQDSDTSETLRARLFERSAEVLIEMLEPYIHNKIKPKVQDENEATFTTKILKDHAFIPEEVLRSVNSGQPKEDWEIKFVEGQTQTATPVLVDSFVRAMQPWPIAWTKMNEKRIKIMKSHLEENKFVIDEVQVEGKNAVTWSQFKQGYPNFSSLSEN